MDSFRKNKGRLLVRLFVAVTLLLLALDVIAGRAVRMSLNKGKANPSTALYEESFVDMEVKTLWGNLELTRMWANGRWTFNPNWTDLQLFSRNDSISAGSIIKSGSSSAGSSGSSIRVGFSVPGDLSGEASADTIKTIRRNTYTYKVSETDPDVYTYKYRNIIRRTETGYRWTDAKGNWIDYNVNGQMLRLGNRNNVTFNFARNDIGLIEHVLDHFNTVIATYTYDNLERPTSVTDYSGRVVSYHWQGRALEKVTDVRGHDWLFSYGELFDNYVLKSKTDPEGRVVTINYQVRGGSTGCASGSGGKWVRSGDTWSYKYTKCNAYYYSPPWVAHSGLSDEIGVLTSNQFFYDDQNKIYKNITTIAGPGRVSFSINLDGHVIASYVNDELAYEANVSSDEKTWSETDRNGNRTVKVYDDARNLKSISYADGTNQTWTYDQFSNVLKYKDQNGNITENEYDERGNLLRSTEAKGSTFERITEYEFDQYGRVTLMRELGDTRTQTAETKWTSYDNYGNVLTQIDPEGIETTYTYDVLGNELSFNDGRDNTWRTTYDEAGNVLTVSSPLGLIETNSYDKVGNLVETTDAENFTQKYSYNQRNQLISETDVVSAEQQDTTNYSYDTNNNVTSVTDALGGTNTQEFDNFSRIKKSIDAVGNVSEMVYEDAFPNSNGNLFQPQKLITPTYTSIYKYDNRDRLIQKSDVASDSSETRYWTYDANGNVISETDPEGKKSTFTYNAFDIVIEEVDALGHSVKYILDDRENVVQLIDSKGNTTTYKFDKNDRLVEESNALSQKTTYTYDDTHNPIKIVSPNGNVTIMTYDADNRMTSRRLYLAVDLETPTKVVDYTHNLRDQILTWDDGRFVGTINYDVKGRLDSESVNYGSFSKDFSYDYYGNDLIKSFTGPDGVTDTYLYDKADKLSAIVIPDVGHVSYGAYQWEAPTDITFPGGMKQKISYNGMQVPSNIEYRDVANNLQDNIYLERNSRQQITKITRSTGSTKPGAEKVKKYDYTDTSRLSSVATLSAEQNPTPQDQKILDWDAMGNLSMVGEEWEYNTLNQLISRPGASYEYDANGNLTLLTSEERVLEFTYDVEDRLILVKSADVVIAEYAYDIFGRRLWKKTQTEELYFTYNESGITAEFDNTGALVKTFGFHPYASFSTDPIYLKQAGQYYYYVKDYVNGPLSLRTASGQLVWSAEYDQLSKATVSVDNINNPLRNPGQYEDKETGLYYNFNRYYDPNIGRYITQDPLGIEGGLNLYLYAESDPINKYDPTGEIAPAVAKGLICMAVDALTSGCAPTLGSTVSCFFGIGPLKRVPKLPCPLKNSFTGETLVHTADGLKPIKSIVIGDEVLSLEEWSGNNVLETVDNIIIGEKDYLLFDIKLSNGDNVEATEGHPFYVSGKGWVAAKKLARGDLLVTETQGVIEVINIEYGYESKKVFNLSVERTNTYYVGKEAVLVHNSKKGCGGKRRKNRLPDKGEPNTVAENAAGTTRKKYGPDGNVQKEYNKGHGPNAPKNEQNDHIHDYKPNPNNPSGRGDRQPGRPPRPRDLNDMNLL